MGVFKRNLETIQDIGNPSLTEEFNKYSLKMAFERNKLFRAQRAEKSRWKG